MRGVERLCVGRQERRVQRCGRRASMTTRSLKIALMHLTPDLGALDANRALIESATRSAVELGADWAVSGELVVSGCRFAERIGTGWIEEQPDRWLQRLARLSTELGVVSFVSQRARRSAESSTTAYSCLAAMAAFSVDIASFTRRRTAKRGRAPAYSPNRPSSTAFPSDC
jgi:hypothetical protein